MTGRFVVAYSGNLGRVHDLDTVIAGAAALREDPAVVFLFIGSGAQECHVRSEILRLGLRNVRFLSAQPRAELAGSIAAADLHLVTLKPGCEHYVFPSKLYGIVAVGRPVLFVGPTDCELARLVREHDLGRVVGSGATGEFASAILELRKDEGAYERCVAGAARFARVNSAEARLREWHDVLRAVHAC